LRRRLNLHHLPLWNKYVFRKRFFYYRQLPGIISLLLLVNHKQCRIMVNNSNSATIAIPVLGKKFDRKVLPSSFKPPEHSVICGRGKSCTNHPGNRLLKKMVASSLKEYCTRKPRPSWTSRTLSPRLCL
jgi:hypothetical protein